MVNYGENFYRKGSGYNFSINNFVKFLIAKNKIILKVLADKYLFY